MLYSIDLTALPSIKSRSDEKLKGFNIKYLNSKFSRRDTNLINWSNSSIKRSVKFSPASQPLKITGWSVNVTDITAYFTNGRKKLINGRHELPCDSESNHGQKISDCNRFKGEISGEVRRQNAWRLQRRRLMATNQQHQAAILATWNIFVKIGLTQGY